MRLSKFDGEPNELGKVTWYSSAEDSGPDVGTAVELANGAVLWCGEISRDRWEEAGPDAAELGNDFGTWIILYNGVDTTVIGKCVDRYTADEMINQIAAAVRGAMSAYLAA
jgi:hypothetical protein